VEERECKKKRVFLLDDLLAQSLTTNLKYLIAEEKAKK
jgi:hypothetical protein